MLRRTAIAAPLAALALASALPATAAAVPVPLGACAPAAQPAIGCLPTAERDDGPLAMVARSSLLWRFWSGSAFLLF